MKAKQYMSLLLASVAFILGGMACQDDKYQEPQVTFKVLKTDVPSVYTGGEGYIEVSEEGFEVRTDAEWLQATKAGAKRVTIIVTKNENPESRTANVLLIKGATVQRVAVTQVGVINDAAVSNQEFTRTGGTYEVDLSSFDSTPNIKVSEGWVNYRIEGKKLIFTVEPLAGSDDRVANVSIIAGLYNRTFTITQVYGAIAYADLLGAYTLSYREWKDGTVKTAPVVLERHQEDRSVKLKGLAADIEMLVDLRTGAFSISCQEVDNQSAKIYAWVAAGQGAFDYSDRYVLVGTWNKDFANPIYTFTANTEIKYVDESQNINETNPVLGFIFWGDSGEYKGVSGNGISRVVQFTLTKNV